MKNQITTQRIVLRRLLRTFIEDHVMSSLRQFIADITLAHVEISDRNGRRGGGDKRCRIRIVPKIGDAIVVEDTEANPKRAIRQAALLAQVAIKRQLRLA